MSNNSPSTERALVRLEEFMDTLVDIPRDIQRTLTKIREVDAKEQHYTVKYHQSIDNLLQMNSSVDAEEALKEAYEQILLSLTVAEESKDLGLELLLKGKAQVERLENILLQFEDDMKSARRNGDLINDFERKDDENITSDFSDPLDLNGKNSNNKGRSNGNGKRNSFSGDPSSTKKKRPSVVVGDKSEGNVNGNGRKSVRRIKGSGLDLEEPRKANLNEFDNVSHQISNLNNNSNNNSNSRTKFKFISENDSFKDEGNEEEGDEDEFAEELESQGINKNILNNEELVGTMIHHHRTSPPISKDGNEPTYCYCNQVSFGEMIGCDDEDCEKEWFHYSCVGLSSPPKGKWYCPDCVSKNSLATQ